MPLSEEEKKERERARKKRYREKKKREKLLAEIEAEVDHKSERTIENVNVERSEKPAKAPQAKLQPKAKPETPPKPIETNNISRKSTKQSLVSILPRQRRKIRLKRKTEVVHHPNLMDLRDMPDIIAEQRNESYHTLFCPEAIEDLKMLQQYPENYLEVNIVRKSRVVDNFYIPVDKKQFHYKNVVYPVKENGIYLMPTKSGLLMPTSFYRENHKEPAIFKNTNKGITGRALTLLYKEGLYRQILFAEEPKYNLFIVILLIATLVAFAVGCYFVFLHGGPPPEMSGLVTGG